jgi:hypothetical protein
LTARSDVELHIAFGLGATPGSRGRSSGATTSSRCSVVPGHKLIGTTQHYIVEAENRGATFGTPFPPLPACLLDVDV